MNYYMGTYHTPQNPRSTESSRPYKENGIKKSGKFGLDPREASLVEVFRRLPPDTAAELSALAERLAALSPHRKIDWSDSWSDEDLRDFRAASLRRLDAEESEEPH